MSHAMMKEFEIFLRRLHGISIRYVGRDHFVLRKNATVLANARLSRGKEIRVMMDLNTRWATLLRFHIARTQNIPVRMYDANVNRENSCSETRCFVYLQDAFPEEWSHFNGFVSSASSAKKVSSANDADAVYSAKKVFSVNDADAVYNAKTASAVVDGSIGATSKVNAAVRTADDRTDEHAVLKHMQNFSMQLDAILNDAPVIGIPVAKVVDR